MRFGRDSVAAGFGAVASAGKALEILRSRSNAKQDSLIGGVRTGRLNAKLFVPGFIDIGARVSKVPTGRALRFGFFIFPSARWPQVSLLAEAEVRIAKRRPIVATVPISTIRVSVRPMRRSVCFRAEDVGYGANPLWVIMSISVLADSTEPETDVDEKRILGRLPDPTRS